MQIALALWLITLYRDHDPQLKDAFIKIIHSQQVIYRSSKKKQRLFRNQESNIKMDMNNSIKNLRTESSQKKTRTIPIRIVHKQPNQRRRLKLLISVINQMMIMSEEQLQERCIDILKSLAKPINGFPSLDYRDQSWPQSGISADNNCTYYGEWCIQIFRCSSSKSVWC